MPDRSQRTKTDSIPLLGYALLGLIHQKPSSGYDLRKIFATTAMGNYSSSPGAIYPALQRLETSGLITGMIEETAGMRRRCVYHIAKPGSVALKRWLTLPVGPDKVRRDQGELMLRFAFTEHVLGPSACVRFLRDFGAALSPYIAELETFLASHRDQMPLSARLALESGLRNYRCTYDWTGYALRAYQDLQANRSMQPSRSLKGGRI
jgi:DNA-binding PadR family transcriptional regulator